MTRGLPIRMRCAGSLSRGLRTLVVIPLVLITLQDVALSWVYPEHRNTAYRGIQLLDPYRSMTLHRLWAEGRRGYEFRLAATPLDSLGSRMPTTLDYAAWPAIAGDHSCSSANMLHNILESDWIIGAAAVGAQLYAVLSDETRERHARTNALRDADLKLLRVDPDYATRAGSNNVHFLLARPTVDTDVQTYLETCLSEGCDLNALGTYAWYHVSALRKVDRLSRMDTADSARSRLALSALADEAFAIHFLQDVFAAGHVAGTRGDASLRKGTHDYYNERGLEVRTWEGKSMVIKGDAWMSREDGDRTADAVRASLEQFVDASDGKAPFFPSTPSRSNASTPDSLDACDLTVMPAGVIPQGVMALLNRIIRTTPVPGLAEGEGELPRFRSELGPFIGVVPAARGGMMSGGVGQFQKEVGGTGGLELAVRLGLGLDGVMNEWGDGLVFLDLGFRLDAASSRLVTEDADLKLFGHIFAATPSRGAFTARLRVPFWLVPLDLLIAAPVLGTTSSDSFTRMAAVAANGGLIPWQAGIATSIGRFQFILGREMGVSFYGYLKSADRFMIPFGDPAIPDAVLANLRSVQLEFPFLEYMPFRTFSTDQSSSLVIQFFGAVDIPTRTSDLFPPIDPELNLRTVWQGGMRAAFRWRHYW